MHWKPFSDQFYCIMFSNTVVCVCFVLLSVADGLKLRQSGHFVFEDKLQVAQCVGFKVVLVLLFSLMTSRM